MRDVLEDIEKYLSNNDYSVCHPIISRLANEIVRLRADKECILKYGRENFTIEKDKPHE